MVRRLALLAVLLASSAHADRLSPPPTREAQARVQIAPYRYDDVLWENDRTAHRIYGHALEAAEPPSGSGIDAWGKSVRWPFMDRQLRSGDQHAEHGEGLDFYDVRTGRGAGGLGIWYDNKLWTSRNYRVVRILNPGPKVASFEVSYAPWPVDIVRNVRETRRFTLPLGTSFTRLVSTLQSSTAGPLVVGIGIGKHTTGPGREDVLRDPAHGFLSVWSLPAEGKGSMAVAILFDPKSLVRITEDADNYLILLRQRPGVPFVYYSGAAWDGGPDFHDRNSWTRYVRAQRPDFDPRH
ncbi:DUF4861 family protein [Sphingomonas crusticola]|uniref:DUF4861 family protein n=1 Tax=Sphingomonas crusticola TaxID=1697973 RepID=UPI000E23FB93|nr:DUF4861 family protein [Sphingomonas crusticola]